MRFRAIPAAVAVLAPALAAMCAGHRLHQAAAPQPPSPAMVAVAPVETGSRSTDVFASRVRPVLEQRCTPCHFAGGKMYGRLPFDDPEAVRSNPEGILQRLKDPEQHQIVEEWVRAPRP